MARVIGVDGRVEGGGSLRGTSRRIVFRRPAPDTPRNGFLGAENSRSTATAGPEHGTPTGPVPALSSFRVVGTFSLLSLVRPEFQFMLDMMRQTHGAFEYVRGFDALTEVWPSSASEPDFKATIDALDQLVQRGLKPLLVLGFAPKKMPSPETKAGIDFWRDLVERFLAELAKKYSADEIASWLFEVWNEPDNRNFFPYQASDDIKTMEDVYCPLFRATAEAVIASGVPARIGGPATIYKSKFDGPGNILILFGYCKVHKIKIDFVSFHCKGNWTGEGDPDIDEVSSAVLQVANLALEHGFHNTAMINDEADMRVLFDKPFERRLRADFACWLAAVMTRYCYHSSSLAGLQNPHAGMTFAAGSDNANLQLVSSAFDPARSIVTFDADEPGLFEARKRSSLLKLPVFQFYELAKMLGTEYLEMAGGSVQAYPHDAHLHLMGTHSNAGWMILASNWNVNTGAKPVDVSFVLDGIWESVNLVGFRLTNTGSGTVFDRFKKGAGRKELHMFAELPEDALPFPALKSPWKGFQKKDHSTNGTLALNFCLNAMDTMLLWVSPYIKTLGFKGGTASKPMAPYWMTATKKGGDVIIMWGPAFLEPDFLTYELWEMELDEGEWVAGKGVYTQANGVLRSAMYLDADSALGEEWKTRIYGVRRVNTSGFASAIVKTQVKEA